MLTPASPDTPSDAPPASGTQMYMVATRCRQRFALPVSVVREVLRMPELEPVPLAPPALRGAFHLRGEITPVIAPDSLLAIDEPESPAGEVLALLQDHNGVLALQFDRILGVVSLPVDGLMPHPLVSRRPWMARLHLDPRFQLVTVLDGAALINAASESINFQTLSHK